MQNHYNLLYREEEREMMPLLRELGVASTPYSPLAAGRLTRDWDADTDRARTDTTAKTKYDSTQETDREIVEQVARIAAERGVERVHVALGLAAGEGSGGSPRSSAPRRPATSTERSELSTSS